MSPEDERAERARAEHLQEEAQEKWLKRTKEGGTAFPAHGCTPGMTLRDYFAGQALVGILSGLLAAGLRGPGQEFPEDHKAARWAYEYADAMLKARDK